MPSKTGSARMDAMVDELLERLIAGGATGAQLIGDARQINEVAFHDFSSYRFLLTPSRLRFSDDEDGSIIDDLQPAEVPLDHWLDFEAFVSQFRVFAQALVESWIYRQVTRWVRVDDDYVREYPVEGVERDRHIQGVILDGHEGFRLGMAPSLYELYTMIEDVEGFISDARAAVETWLLARLDDMRNDRGAVRYDDFYRIQKASFWQAGVDAILAALADYVAESESGDRDEIPEEDRLPTAYSFDPFLPQSVNFGIQVIYRQSWIPLGTQPGEIVRTLPLGPRQTEKVSFKAVRRNKSTRQAEMATSIETATESSAATKDSQEVVQEASEKFNWHVEASASANYGFGSASLTAGMGGENASSSRDTKATLNETMEKTASKIRKDTKIVVSTEIEETSEFTQSSEITNPNDEVAVTYIYSRLQRQYEIRTHLSELNTVIYVAEPVPAPGEIGGAWIRRYDWILSRELLDDSFRSDLELVRSHRPDGGEEEMDENIRSLMESLSGGSAPGLPDYSGLRGELPDIFQNPQQAYEREVERQRARRAENEEYRRAVRRLAHHIYDNVLHYCRAIWTAEDPDARLLRYGKIRVPIHWELVSAGTPSGHTIDGYYAPAVHDYERDTAPLADMINPAGPIGFAGNYAVYYLRESERWSSLSAALDHMRIPYLRTRVRVTPADSVSSEVIASGLASDNRIGEGRYRLEFDTSEGPQFRIQQERAGGVYTEEMLLPAVEGQPLQFHALRISIGPLSALTSGDSFDVTVAVIPQLEDPELKALRWTEPPLGETEEAAFFSPEVLAECSEYFSDVHRALTTTDSGASRWEELSGSTRDLLRSRYHAYLLRKRHTRKLAVDTNNLMLTREVDRTSTLEPFKGLHRLADVLGAFEEASHKRLESDRRQARIDAGQLGDPEIEKVTVVAGTGEFSDLAALDGLTPDPEEEPAPQGEDV